MVQLYKSPKKAKTEGCDLDKEKAEQVIDEMPGIPIVPTDTDKKPGVIFILERASLEIGKVGKSYQLLSSDEHANYLMKNKRNPAEYHLDSRHCFSDAGGGGRGLSQSVGPSGFQFSPQRCFFSSGLEAVQLLQFFRLAFCFALY
ncbi:unnamed protein product [Fraxinus pennsylvanica]|uniref:Uncharacterized protein n=1 Tax=Fraxinus pennsylvanica TaxID=56036 RepID=A0AAD1ZGG8_9LAMI|nr:unnamed protein product [Fraxinus pennsylvanica]